MGKYLNPKADLTFKKIFGENKHLVISLLNALLPLEDEYDGHFSGNWSLQRGNRVHLISLYP